MLRRNTPQAAARLPASAAAFIAVPGMSVDTSAVGADWECPVCAHPIVPRTVFPCGHALCLACSHQVEDCPMCRVEIIFRAADHVATQHVLGLLTYRCAPPGGCGFVGSRDAALAHRCPYIVQIVRPAARAQQPLPPPCGVLLQAAAEGSVATIDAFVAQHGPGVLSVTAPTSSGTPYFWCAGWTLAHIAAYHGRVDVLDCLVRLTGGTDVLVAVVSGTSAAFAAVIGGSIPAVEFIRSLLGEGAFGVRNPASHAAMAGRVPMLLHLAATLGPGVLVGAFGPETITPVKKHWLKARLLDAIAAAHAAGNAAPDAVVDALRGAFGWTREEEEEAAAALQAP